MGASHAPLAIAGVVGALVIGGLAVILATSDMAGATIDGPGPSGVAVASEGLGVGPGEIVVDVAGAVVNPGVYRLRTGSRVGESIELAGGFNARVDAERVASELNLAAVLDDGAQVRVPSRDDSAPAGGGPGVSEGEGDGGGLIDLNAASQSELESLPGIGPVTAEKIMASRDEAPFRSIDELRERGLVGEKTFEDIRALVTVG
jgi:competence protein ComEA